MRAHARSALVGVALLGLLAGCGDDDKSEFPAGVYHPIGGSDAEGTMEFSSDGTWVLTAGDGDVYSEGTYSVDGDLFTFVTDSFCKGPSGVNESATYTWTQDGDTVTMTLEGEDGCTARVEVVARGFEKSTG